MKKHVLASGIPGIGMVPHDFHMCHFYPSREELLEALIPYYIAGVNNNERCIWITAPTVPANGIKKETAKYSELAQAEKSGQLTIADSQEWYGDLVSLSIDAAVQRWFDEEERALANGYVGLRVAGNASFMPRENWPHLMEYEKKFHDRARGRRIMTCCSYPREAYRPIDILEVTRCHDAALDRSDTHWQVFLHSSSQGA